MTTEERVSSLSRLGEYLSSDDETLQQVKRKAEAVNGWFTREFVDFAIATIVAKYLNKEKLIEWAGNYTLPTEVKKVGIVTAGNIPLVGFHDMLCGLMSGHEIHLKLSSKDEPLMAHVVRKLAEMDERIAKQYPNHRATEWIGCVHSHGK